MEPTEAILDAGSVFYASIMPRKGTLKYESLGWRTGVDLVSALPASLGDTSRIHRRGS